MQLGFTKATSLIAGWELAFAPAGAAADPAALEAMGLAWIPAQVPGTSAGALRALGQWSLDAVRDSVRDFEADDTWYRCTLTGLGQGARTLRFAGLATLCEVFVDGKRALTTGNQFRAHELDLDPSVGESATLHLRFLSLKKALAAKRPRPRWKTRLVEQQQLRWLRTTLLGRIPGWTPPVTAVGPWKPVTLLQHEGPRVRSAMLRTEVEGTTGVAALALVIEVGPGDQSAAGGAAAGADAAIEAELELAGQRVRLQQTAQDGASRTLAGTLRIADVALWWPHTHGAPALHEATLHLSRGESAHGPAVTRSQSLGKVGFRTIAVDQTDGKFTVSVNGVEVFCRGACWTTLDPVVLHGDAAGYTAAVEQARACGMNLVRVGGTMTYEDDAFYSACDAAGVLVWQDFMFANLDYPVGDAAFAEDVRIEVRQQLGRIGAHPCLAILCGGSEVEQQAAMLGLPRESWSGPLFEELLPAESRALCPGVPYVTNSPTGGPLPFTVNQGVSHYYGVGAYLRPMEDARRAEVKFTSECLAFANVPVQETVDELLTDAQAPGHHPRWKARVPRDTGPGWDFEDVRDHYLKLLYGLDAVTLRSTQPERWLELSRAVSAEVMEATFAEWRRARSTCKGGVVWFLRDLWRGAGWGVVDSEGRPKPAWWALKRAFQPVALFVSDEGLNGLVAHAINETAQPLDVTLSFELIRDDVRVGHGERALTLPARSNQEVDLGSLLEGFRDVTWAFRFGPPGHLVSIATLRGAEGKVLSQAFHFPGGRPSAQAPGEGGRAWVETSGDARVLVVEAAKFLQSVHLELDGHSGDDDWFHLGPGVQKRIPLAPGGKPGPVRGELIALNLHAPIRVGERP
ncbi:MAG: glycoside hydrolase family 2 protein [Deltaproteobacteria bacterium]|nr:glycoside hydrolase family 2 protein [Deltaproteobacteria bacterium]